MENSEEHMEGPLQRSQSGKNIDNLHPGSAGSNS